MMCDPLLVLSRATGGKEEGEGRVIRFKSGRDWLLIYPLLSPLLKRRFQAQKKTRKARPGRSAKGACDVPSSRDLLFDLILLRCQKPRRNGKRCAKRISDCDSGVISAARRCTEDQVIKIECETPNTWQRAAQHQHPPNQLVVKMLDVRRRRRSDAGDDTPSGGQSLDELAREPSICDAVSVSNSYSSPLSIDIILTGYARIDAQSITVPHCSLLEIALSTAPHPCTVFLNS